MSFGLEPLYKQITDLEAQLKDAQKEITDSEKCIDVLQTKVYQLEKKIAELTTANEFLNQESQTLQGLVVKIEAIKPIIEKWCKECMADCFAACEADCGIRDIVALLFPRKEEGKLSDEEWAKKLGDERKPLGPPPERKRYGKSDARKF